MIQLNPIAKEIQKTLLEKMRMSGKTDTSISEPLSKSDGSTPSRNPDLSYLSQRTIWSRMIALSLPKYTNKLKLIQEGELIQEFASNPAKPVGLNSIGMQRGGISDDEIKLLKKAYRILYRDGNLLIEAISKINELDNNKSILKIFIDSIENSSRGILR